MSSQLTRPSTPSARSAAALPPRAGVRHATTLPPRRGGTLGLEIQSAAAFALALLIGVGALVVAMPLLASVALLAVAVTIITRALAVLAIDPTNPQLLRPRELANWDGTIAASLSVLALVFVVAFATGGAFVAALGAIGMAFLRLRTRYVIA